MADEVQDPRAPGWKHDPTGRFLGRYWDGTAWTEHVVSQERITSIDPIPVRPAQPGASTQAPRSTGVASPVPAPSEGVPLWAKVGLVVAAAVLFLVTRAGEDSDPPAASASTSVAVIAPGPPSMHVLGETVRSGDFDITVHGFSDPEAPGEFLKPEPGRHFMSVDVEVANRTSRQRSFSFLLSFHLLDARGNQLDATFSDVKPPPPDGEIAPGQSLRGRVLFEIPDGTSGFRFKAQGSLTEPGALFPLR